MNLHLWRCQMLSRETPRRVHAYKSFNHSFVTEDLVTKIDTLNITVNKLISLLTLICQQRLLQCVLRYRFVANSFIIKANRICNRLAKLNVKLFRRTFVSLPLDEAFCSHFPAIHVN